MGTFLEVVQNRLPDCKHVMGSIANLEDWVAAGRPRCWELVESANGIQVYVDSGHGMLASFRRGVLHLGKWNVKFDDFVILDKDYYGTTSYIFKAVGR